MHRLLPLALLAACGPLDSTNKNTPFEPGDFERIDITSVAGSVTVGINDESPSVGAILSWRGDVQPEITTRLAGSTLLVASSCPEEVRKCSVDFDIKIPSTADVDVLSVVGAVTMDGVGGFSDVVVLEGDAILRDVSGTTRLDVQAGNVELDGVTGRMKMSVPDGSTVGVALGSPTFEYRGADDTVEIEFNTQPDLVEMQSENGDVILRVPDGEYDVFTTTRNGTVSVNGINNVDNAGSVVVIETVRGDITVEGR